MPFQIEHRCHESDPDPSPYAIARRDNPPPPVSILLCQRCGEKLILLGDRAFGDAHLPSYNRIPGLVLPGMKD